MRKRLICLLLMLLPVLAAAETASLTWVSKTEEDCQRFLKNVALVRWTEDVDGRAPVCFDVRTDGMIALGFDRPRGGKYVAVMDNTGAVQYGYVFQCTGSFLVEWTEDGLGIYWIRSSVFAAFDEQGSCTFIGEYDPNRTASRRLNQLGESRREIGGEVFTLQNGRLIRRDALGEEHILHDGSGAAVLGWFRIAAATVFAAVCIGLAARKKEAGRIDNPPNSCYNYTCSEKGRRPWAMKRRTRVHRPQRELPRLKEARQRRATDSLEPPGESRARSPRYRGGEALSAGMTRKWVAPRKSL